MGKRLTPEQREFRNRLEKATQTVTDLKKRMRAASYKSLSMFSKNLIQEQYQQAVETQMNIIGEMIDKKSIL